MGPIEMCEALKAVKPVMEMVVVQIAYAGMNIFYKLAANDGMNLRVLVAYRMMFATVFIAPLALIFERGLFAQNLYKESLYLTSASFASAITNLIPAVTFVLAVSFRIVIKGHQIHLHQQKATAKAPLSPSVDGLLGALSGQRE
ncbi:hypothetical protein LWI28_027638 [Acer negundo]|uniref:WAT1-related protein n=1 Tax=Acer negundo TaxID=4023 RepID=A0AAD5IWC4_ACENE|nr:hypothetical protein LWI28_027638 [Acer negundo]